MGNDILVIQFFCFLPIGDDDEDFGGIFSGPVCGTEQSISVGEDEGPEASEQSRRLAPNAFVRTRGSSGGP